MNADDSPDWTPAFDGQRPPFKPGNSVGVQFKPGHELAVTHGAYSPRKIDPLAETFVDLVLTDPAVVQLRAPHWRPALWAWARSEAQVQLLTEYLEKVSGDDGVGDLGDERVKAAYLLLHRAETRAMASRRQLGLDPLSAARLGRDRASEAVDTARLMQELQRVEAEKQQQEQEAGR